MVFPFLSEHSHSIPTALPKYSHGVHIAFPWYSIDIEVFPHHSQTVQMLLPQYSSLQSAESIPMMFAHIIPMPFLWFYSHMLFPHPIALPDYWGVLPCFPPKVFPDHSHSIPTASPKNSHGVPIVLPWYFPQCSQTTPILQGVFSQYSHSVYPVCPWSSHSMLVLFLWCSSDHADQLAVSHPAKPRRTALWYSQAVTIALSQYSQSACQSIQWVFPLVFPECSQTLQYYPRYTHSILKSFLWCSHAVPTVFSLYVFSVFS